MKGLMSPDDPYYHAKHSKLVAEANTFTIVKPWVAFHFFSYSPVDPYVLDHFITALFIKIFGIINGLKIFTAILAASIFLIFYFILKKWSIPRPFLWTFLFFASSSLFLFRVMLERPFVGAIAMLMLSLYLLVEKKYYALAVLCMIDILFYNLAVFILFPTIVLVIVECISEKQCNLKSLIAVLGGLTLGLLLHPQTMNYILIIYTHFFKVFYLKLTGVTLLSGVEINVHDVNFFFLNNMLSCLAYIVGLALFLHLYSEKYRSKILVFLCAISVPWFIICIFIPRGVEYFTPLAWIFCACTFAVAKKQNFFDQVRMQLSSCRYALPILKYSIALLVLGIIGFNLYVISKTILDRNKIDNVTPYQLANEYLIQNTSKNSIVFYPIWSMFPRMFYFNTHNRFMAAFDPIYAYSFSPEYYWTMANIGSSGTYCDHTPPCTELSARKSLDALPYVFKYIFETNTIVIPQNQTKQLYTVLENQKKYFEQVYQNSELTIYTVR